MNREGIVILGAGITGLSAGYVLQAPIYEKRHVPGGISSSYYINSTVKQRRSVGSPDDYRFEIGGGHWIFSDNEIVTAFIHALSPLRWYRRRAAVYFPEKEEFVPSPLQYHLRYLGYPLGVRVLAEMIKRQAISAGYENFDEWLQMNFGKTLYRMFFGPFHDLYTAGLSNIIAPQDQYKTPINLTYVLQGMFRKTVRIEGYNAQFAYPTEGLNALVMGLANRCTIHYGKEVARINPTKRYLEFRDGTRRYYETLISTLPLDDVLSMCGINLHNRGLATSVLVINIGAIKGAKCPTYHWVYIPESRSGFHRVGFYSNVDPSFLPVTMREKGVSLYVEKSYRKGKKPSGEEIHHLISKVVEELQQWRWIEDIDIIDYTWVDSAYTWRLPGSTWRENALSLLAKSGIYQIGRYARWKFQGISASIRDGLILGSTLLRFEQVLSRIGQYDV